MNAHSLCVLCLPDINECEREPCKNGGICTDLVANYSCECPGEYMGKNCQYSKYSSTAVCLSNISPSNTLLVTSLLIIIEISPHTHTQQNDAQRIELTFMQT